MSTGALQARWITRFFMLIYLLLSISTANASFWCHGAQNASHLESNPIGKCWTVCAPENAVLQGLESAPADVAWSMPQDGSCLDSPVYSSVLTSSHRTNPLGRILVADIDAVDPASLPDSDVLTSRFAGLSRPPLLPVPQALTALRTVVLRH